LKKVSQLKMDLNQQAIPAGDERLAGSLMNVILTLQKNRQRGIDGSTPSLKGSPQEGAEVLGAMRDQKQNEQKENATGTPGVLPQERGQEGGRQRDVGQGEEESGIGQSPQVQGADKMRQYGRKMM
jgi:hypothetical protein